MSLFAVHTGIVYTAIIGHSLLVKKCIIDISLEIHPKYGTTNQKDYKNNFHILYAFSQYHICF